MKFNVCHLLFSNSQEFLNVAFLNMLVFLVSICIQSQKYEHTKFKKFKESHTLQNNFRLMCTQLCRQRPQQTSLQVKNDVQKTKENVTEP